jgi:hypothetical protein
MQIARLLVQRDREPHYGLLASFFASGITLLRAAMILSTSPREESTAVIPICLHEVLVANPRSKGDCPPYSEVFFW